MGHKAAKWLPGVLRYMFRCLHLSRGPVSSTERPAEVVEPVLETPLGGWFERVGPIPPCRNFQLVFKIQDCNQNIVWLQVVDIFFCIFKANSIVILATIYQTDLKGLDGQTISLYNQIWLHTEEPCCYK